MKRVSLIIILVFIYSCLSAQWHIIQIDSLIPSKNDIRSIVFDNQGSIWIGTSYGVYQEDGDSWKKQTPDNESLYIESLNINTSGEIFGGVWGGGVYRANITNREWLKDNQASISMSANSIFTDSKGTTWIGTWDKGVVEIGVKKTSNYTSVNALLGDNTITCFAEGENNEMWIGTLHGVSSYDGTSWKLYNKELGKLPSNDIYALTVDKDGSLWIGTASGLVKKIGETWTVFSSTNSILPSNTILSLTTDLNNVIWIGTNKGIVGMKGDQQKIYTTENSNLVDNRIQTIIEKNGKLYVGTQLGLAVLDLSTFSF